MRFLGYCDGEDLFFTLAQTKHTEKTHPDDAKLRISRHSSREESFWFGNVRVLPDQFQDSSQLPKSGAGLVLERKRLD